MFARMATLFRRRRHTGHQKIGQPGQIHIGFEDQRIFTFIGQNVL